MSSNFQTTVFGLNVRTSAICQKDWPLYAKRLAVSDNITKQDCFPDANQVLDREHAKSLVLQVEAESSDRRSAR